MYKALQRLLSVCVCILLMAGVLFARSMPKSGAANNSILSLYDAFGYQKKGTVLDWGFAVLIHYNGKTILFDTGNDADKFAHNVKALGVDLRKVDFAVLSHRHPDHVSGFEYALRQKPSIKAYVPDDVALGAPDEFKYSHETNEQLAGVPPEQLYFGGKNKSMLYKPGSILAHAHAEYVGESKQIAPGIFLIYTVSPLVGDFNAYPPREPGHPELSGLPEISLALQTKKGIVLITGCSHSKVERIVAATKEFTHSNIELVDGGFHLLPYDEAYIKELAKKMKNEMGVHRVAPAHCTGNLAFKIFRELYGSDYSYAGVESIVSF